MKWLPVQTRLDSSLHLSLILPLWETLSFFPSQSYPSFLSSSDPVDDDVGDVWCVTLFFLSWFGEIFITTIHLSSFSLSFSPKYYSSPNYWTILFLFFPHLSLLPLCNNSSSDFFFTIRSHFWASDSFAFVCFFKKTCLDQYLRFVSFLFPRLSNVQNSGFILLYYD